MDIRKWIVLSDLQIPYHDGKTLRAVEKYMASQAWDGYLNIGDFLDFDCISSFNEKAPRLIETKRLMFDYEEGNKILDRHQQIIRRRNKKARFILLEGNHEERVERYLNAFPQLEGMIEVEVGLRLKERDFDWIRCWSKGEIFQIGHANFLHGQYTNAYHAKKMVEMYGGSVFYGHTHDIMCIPKASKLNRTKTIVGQSIGCLCDLEQSYMKGKPNNWQQGFAVFYFLPDGTYTYYVVRIIDHKFVGPDGILYKP